MVATFPSDIDVLIVGAGIAGASLAAELAPHRRVLMIESEEVAGFHATGRSAAFWQESYGGVGVQPLTAASFAASLTAALRASPRRIPGACLRVRRASLSERRLQRRSA